MQIHGLPQVPLIRRRRPVTLVVMVQRAGIVSLAF